MRPRRKSVPVRVGDVVIGGAAEIVVQSMTKADTRDVKATLNEIARLKDANCRIVRVAVPTREAAQAMVDSPTAPDQTPEGIYWGAFYLSRRVPSQGQDGREMRNRQLQPRPLPAQKQTPALRLNGD